jgi:hypothetical protein
MSKSTLFFLASTMFEVVAVAWAAWQIWSIRPDKKTSSDAPSALARSSSENARHPEG